MMNTISSAGTGVNSAITEVNAKLDTLTISERSETPPRPFASIYFSRDPDFVQRGDILEGIASRCSNPPGRAGIAGLGGVGKSQLAIEYPYRVSEADRNTWVFWIHAETRPRVEEGFKLIADMVKLPGRNLPKANIPQLVHAWLANERNGKWVMILDSADDEDVFYGATADASDPRPLASHLPQSRNGSIVVTTRDRDFAARLTGGRRNVIEVGPMSEPEALAMLERRLGSPLSDTDRHAVTGLVRALDFVPLAISQAAAYIQQRAPRSSLEKYLAEFRKNEKKKVWLLEHDVGDLRRDGSASNSVLTTWKMSFDHIRSKRQSAADLLSLMSFFDRQGVPEEVLRPSRKAILAILARKPSETECLITGSSDDDAEADDDADSSATEFEDDIAMLTAYGLVTSDDQGALFEMHGLIQLATKKWLESEALTDAFKVQCVERLEALYPYPDKNRSNWITCQRLLAHVEMAMEYYQPKGRELKKWEYLMMNAGYYACQTRKTGTATRMWYKTLNILEERGKQTAEFRTVVLAPALVESGSYKEAEKVVAVAAELYKTELGASHALTLSSLLLLADTIRFQGRFEEAEELQAQTMKASKTDLGVYNDEALAAVEDHGTTLLYLDRYEEAEKILLHVLKAREEQLGPDHDDTLRVKRSLGKTLSRQNQLCEAEKMLLQVIEARKAKHGDADLNTMESMFALAEVFYAQDRFDEAEAIHRKVMDGRKKKLGREDPHTIMSMTGLATVLYAQSRFKDANEMISNVFEISRTVRPNSESTLGLPEVSL